MESCCLLAAKKFFFCGSANLVSRGRAGLFRKKTERQREGVRMMLGRKELGQSNLEAVYIRNS